MKSLLIIALGCTFICCANGKHIESTKQVVNAECRADYLRHFIDSCYLSVGYLRLLQVESSRSHISGGSLYCILTLSPSVKVCNFQHSSSYVPEKCVLGTSLKDLVPEFEAFGISEFTDLDLSLVKFRVYISFEGPSRQAEALGGIVFELEDQVVRGYLPMYKISEE